MGRINWRRVLAVFICLRAGRRMFPQSPTRNAAITSNINSASVVSGNLQKSHAW